MRKVLLGLCICVSCFLFSQNAGYKKISYDNKHGITDQSGKVILPANYTDYFELGNSRFVLANDDELIVFNFSNGKTEKITGIKLNVFIYDGTPFALIYQNKQLWLWEQYGDRRIKIPNNRRTIENLGKYFLVVSRKKVDDNNFLNHYEIYKEADSEKPLLQKNADFFDHYEIYDPESKYKFGSNGNGLWSKTEPIDYFIFSNNDNHEVYDQYLKLVKTFELIGTPTEIKEKAEKVLNKKLVNFNIRTTISPPASP